MARGEKAKLIVVINGRYPDWTDVSSGVPQGSVLGPTLFLIFINDLEDGAQSTVLKFTDDTKLYTEVTKEEGGEQLQDDLDKCAEWAKQWMMEFNVAKCKKQNEGVHNERKYSGKSTGGERLGSDGTQSNEWKQTGH